MTRVPRHPDVKAVTAACMKATGRKESRVGGFVSAFPGDDRAHLNIDGGSLVGANNTAPEIYTRPLGRVLSFALPAGRARAKECAICQGQGRLAVRLHKTGKSLDEIRAAVDAKFG